MAAGDIITRSSDEASKTRSLAGGRILVKKPDPRTRADLLYLTTQRVLKAKIQLRSQECPACAEKGR